MPQIHEIATALESWAPRGSAQSYDNVGLQVGDGNREVTKGVLALDVTPAVIEEAKEMGAELIVTHHPLIFRPLKNVTAGGWHGALTLRMAEAGIALYSIHTNLDAAPAGVSFAMAEQLGLTGLDFLEPFPESIYKLAVFTPASHAEAVRAALAEAGAGEIGAYSGCAFETDGRGFFKPGDDANPHQGLAGGPQEMAEEVRIEVEVARWNWPTVQKALMLAHPYEAVAYDLYPVLQPNTRAGLGAIGSLPESMPLSAFLETVAQNLSAGSLRYAGDPSAQVKRVAVCGGSGSSLIGKAMRAGADAYVTADITYHIFFDVLDTEGHPQMALIDAGHYETEAITESLLRDWLSDRFTDVEWHVTRHRTSPMATHVPKPS